MGKQLNHCHIALHLLFLKPKNFQWERIVVVVNIDLTQSTVICEQTELTDTLIQNTAWNVSGNFLCENIFLGMIIP